MSILSWVVTTLLLFLGGWITIANWIIPMRPKGGSLIPVIGGAFVAIAFAISPLGVLNGFWWLPLILDLGCLPLLILTGGYLIWRVLK